MNSGTTEAQERISLYFKRHLDLLGQNDFSWFIYKAGLGSALHTDGSAGWEWGQLVLLVKVKANCGYTIMSWLFLLSVPSADRSTCLEAL